MRVDTSAWKPFKIGDFFDIHPTKAYAGLSNKDLDDGGETPFVVNSAVNNGIGGFSTRPATEKGNIITFSDTTEGNTFFYQPHDFIGFPHVQGMYEKNHAWTRNQLLFLISVLEFTCTGRYTYGRKMTRENIEASLVLLPSDRHGLPDWRWMESYIDSLHSKPLTTGNATGNPNFPLKIDEWGFFRVGDLLDITNGRGITAEEIENHPGDLEAVQSGERNNGVMGLIDEAYCRNMGYAYTERTCLTVARSGTSGYVSLHRNGCVAGDSAKILLLKDGYPGTVPVYLFLQTLLAANRFKYTYGRKVTETLYSDTIIRLPVASDGRVDWRWMEEYITSLPYGDRL